MQAKLQAVETGLRNGMIRNGPWMRGAARQRVDASIIITHLFFHRHARLPASLRPSFVLSGDYAGNTAALHTSLQGPGGSQGRPPAVRRTADVRAGPGEREPLETTRGTASRGVRARVADPPHAREQAAKGQPHGS